MCMARTNFTPQVAPATYAHLQRGDRCKLGDGSPVRTVRSITHAGPGAPWVPQGQVELIFTDGYGAHVLANLPLRIHRTA